MSVKVKRARGAATNKRIMQIRESMGLSRGGLARLTGYSKNYVDNWLAPVGGTTWRRAPENAVRLLEFECGLRKPTYTQES